MQIIYIDDEQSALDNFQLMVASFSQIKSLKVFREGQKALEWAQKHTVDVAFLETKLPEMNGLALAAKLKELNMNTRVIFLTAYSEYAMDAWKIDADGYLLKPYTPEALQKQLNKCITYKSLPSQRIVIETMPTLAVTVNGKAIKFGQSQIREIFALLVDRGDRGITTKEGVETLWPNRPIDNASKSRFRMAYKRLITALEKDNIAHILESTGKRRYLRVDLVDCDICRILSGDLQLAQKYNGRYLEEFFWAEATNEQLKRIILSDEFQNEK